MDDDMDDEERARAIANVKRRLADAKARLAHAQDVGDAAAERKALLEIDIAKYALRQLGVNPGEGSGRGCLSSTSALVLFALTAVAARSKGWLG